MSQPPGDPSREPWSPLGHRQGQGDRQDEPYYDEPYYYDLFTHDTTSGYATPGAPPPPPRRSRRGLWVALAVVAGLLVVAGLVAVAVVAGRSGATPTAAAPVTTSAAAPTTTPPAATTTTAAACPTPAALTGTSAQLGADGLRLGFTVTPGCAAGQVLAGTAELRVLDGTAQVASGTVDLGPSPLGLVPGRPGTLTVVFPAGSFLVVPSTTSAPSLTATLLPAGGRAPREAPATATTTVTAALPPTGDAQDAALQALRRQAAIDAADVDARLAEQWQPQVSSKKAGLTVDGRVLDQSAVLADHLALRARFPDARLVFSGDWTNYRGQDFWVTLAGLPFPTSDAALAWCGQQGLAADSCVAVVLSRTRGPDGTYATR